MSDTPAMADEAVELFALPAKEEQHDHYEIMILVSGAMADDQAKAAYQGVKDLITSHRGEITLEEELGRRALAYTVAGSRQGSYFVAEFDMPKASLPALNAKLRVFGDVARYILVKKRKKTAEEIERELKQREQRMISMQMKKQAELEAGASERKVAPAPVAAKVVPAMATTAAPAVGTPMETPSAPAAATEPAKVAAQPAAPAAAETTEPAKEKSLGDIDAEIEKLLNDEIDV